MKDFAGNELEVGMQVAICVPDYKHLVWATVEKINPQTVTCRYQVSWRNDYTTTTTRYPNQVIVPLQPGWGPPAGLDSSPDENFSEYNWG